MLGMLKAICDIHSIGIIHRDIKHMNCGLLKDSDGKYKVLLFDFGNARLYTNDRGEVSLAFLNLCFQLDLLNSYSKYIQGTPAPNHDRLSWYERIF